MSNKSLIKTNILINLNSKTNITYKGSVFLTLDDGNKLGIYLYGIMIRGIIADISKKEINRQKYKETNRKMELNIVWHYHN